MKRLITLLLPALLALTACSLEDSGQSGTLQAGETLASFSVDLPAEFSGPQGYALAIDDDKSVNEFHVLAFGNDGKLADYAGHNEITQGGETPSFNVKFKKLTIGNEYTFVVLANSGKQYEGLLSSFSDQSTYETLMPKFIQGDGAGSDVTRIPMWGEAEVASLTNNHKITGMKLLRMMAKVNVLLDTNVKGYFKLQSVRLYNYRPDGHIVPLAANLNAGGAAIAPTLTTANRVKGPVLYNSSNGVNLTANECVDAIYTFEANVPMTGSDPNLDEIHCLVIGGKYENNVETYYRVNFRSVDGAGNVTYLPLLRNHRYNITINNVGGNGYTNFEDALGSKGVSVLEAEIIEWDDATMSDIDFDGQYMLSVSKKGWTFDKEARTTSTTDNIIKIVTDYPDGWEIIENSTWLGLSSKGNNEWYLIVGENDKTVDRDGYIIIKAGRITSKITVTQSASAAIVDVESVSLNKTTLELKKGLFETLLPTVLPATATNKTVTWSSSPAGVVDIDANGKVTAIGNGTTTVTVKTNDGNKTDQCTVTVTTAVTGLTLTPSSAPVEVGNTVTLDAKVLPSDASNKVVNWSSSNDGAATVDGNGLVTGVSAGTAIITARTEDGAFTQTSTITVSSATKLITSITLAPNPTTVYKGSMVNLTPTIMPTDADNKTLQWTSSDDTKATVDQDGKVTTKLAGSVTITATAKDGSNVSGTSTITITEGTYVPGTHKGWAGSNIYWDGTKLTFDDEFVTTNQKYQGVYFKWGSLWGISPQGAYSTSTIVYKPGASSGVASGVSWADIPYVDSPSNLTANRDRAFLYEVTDGSTGKGDICRYLTMQNGGGLYGKKWRMPTSNEINDWVNSLANPTSWSNQTANLVDGTYIIAGGRILSNNRLPASGYRNTGGGLAEVGRTGNYWTSSPSTTSHCYVATFGAGGVVFHNSQGTRNAGLPVRCVVEE